MSTKTTFKRVALVAAVAAAFGGLSTVAANATTPPTIAATGGTTATGGTSSAATASAVTGGYVAETVTAGSADKYYTITSTGVGTLAIGSTGAVTGTGSSFTNYTVNSATNVTWYGGTAPGLAPFAGTEVLNFSATSSVAGTQTITVTGNSSTAITETITWGAAAAFNAANSTAVLGSGTTTATASTEQTVVVDKGSSSQVANVLVTVNNGSSTAFNGVALTAVVSGSGLVAANSSASSSGTVSGTYARVASYSASAMASANVAVFGIKADGTAGTGTITISGTDPVSGVTTVIATKTVTFSGPAAKIVASNNTNIIAAGLPKSTAVELYVTDANGNPVSLQASNLTGTAASTTVVSTVGACSADTTTTAHANGAGYYTCSVTTGSSATSGASTKITYVDTVSSVVLATSNTVTISIGGATIASLALTTDASSYLPGTEVTYTLTAKDSSGNPVADGTYGVFAAPLNSAAISGLTSNASLVVAPFAAAAVTSGYNDLAFASGVATSTTYAPYYSGTVTASVTLPSSDSSLTTALLGTTVSASFAVNNPSDAQASAATDAANEATDAANAATDAANAAADAADAATAAAQDASAQAQAALAAVNALSAKITVLAAQIAKIIKKLGA
jgi:hypothetical protein